jgi:hypothetical protein
MELQLFGHVIILNREFANIKNIKQNIDNMPANEMEKRKLPRFHITPCQFHDESLNKNFAVQDISRGGLAIRLVDRDDLSFFTVAANRQGLLKLEGRKFQCSFQVRYIRGTVIGAEWIDLEPDLQKALEKISHPRELGSNLKWYDLQDSPRTVWYHNPFGVDLLIYLQESHIYRWSLFIHQNYLSWDEKMKVRTGKTMAEDEGGYAHGIVRLETKMINFDAQVDLRLMETAMELIQHTPFKEEFARQFILEHLRGAIQS